MSLSDGRDDNNNQPLGEGFITLATSAAHGLVFRSPASANAYRIANPVQFKQPSHGEHNTEVPLTHS